jgi:hypothetical protein
MDGGSSSGAVALSLVNGDCFIVTLRSVSDFNIQVSEALFGMQQTKPGKANSGTELHLSCLQVALLVFGVAMNRKDNRDSPHHRGKDGGGRFFLCCSRRICAGFCGGSVSSPWGRMMDADTGVAPVSTASRRWRGGTALERGRPTCCWRRKDGNLWIAGDMK